MNKPVSLLYLEEPELRFGLNQTNPHPKDGLLLFGPFQNHMRGGALRIGVIGTKKGIGYYDAWAKQIAGKIYPNKVGDPNHTVFPGFEAVFEVRWPQHPIEVIEVDEVQLLNAIRQDDRHQAIYDAVSTYADPIARYNREQSDSPIDLWFVVIPEDIYRLGRPQSRPTAEEKVESKLAMNYRTANRLLRQPSLFETDNSLAEIYRFEKNFHNQLKARLLEHRAVVQILRETTIAPHEFLKANGRPLRQLQDPAFVAWNLATTAFYKGCGQPWRLGSPRPGVCYVGVVFKRDETGPTASHACVGAQMFLDSGDGVVFRGAAGPWYSEDTKTFKLSRQAAKTLLDTVLAAYQASHNGGFPKEVFIHGRTIISEEEWLGFIDAVPSGTSVVCVQIREDAKLKLFRMGDMNVPRGLALEESRTGGLLWSKGFVPRLQTYSGREVPNPLAIRITRGEADIKTVLKDVLTLTKLNYNACIYSDGVPVTLRFADSVGEILTAAPLRDDLPPLPFRFYI